MTLREALAIFGGVFTVAPASASATDPIVVVQVAEPKSPEAKQLIVTCSSALRSGSCRLAQAEDQTDIRAEAVAIVSFTDAEQLTVRIQVGVVRGNGVDWLSRPITFKNVDARVERWRVIGLSIATMVGDLEDFASGELSSSEPFRSEGPVSLKDLPQPPTPETQPAAAPPTEQTEVAPASAPAVVAQATPPRRADPNDASTVLTVHSPNSLNSPGGWSIEPGFLFVPESPRYGAYLRGTSLAYRRLQGLTTLAYSRRPTDDRGLTMSWMNLSVGVAITVAPKDWPLWPRLRGEGLIERVTAAGRDSATGDSDAQSQWLWGGRLGLDVCWPLGRHWAFTLGGDINAHNRGTAVQWGGAQVARFAAINYALLLGGSVRL